MTRIKRLMPFVLVLVLALLFQIGFTALDCKETPYNVATNFAHKYFSLDPEMSNQLCAGDNTEQPAKIIAAFIQRTKDETLHRGFDMGMAKSTLYHIKTHTVHKSDTEAAVHLTACRRTAINPIFPIIAKIFDIGKTYHVDETIKMVKENGHWKVCAPVFDLTMGT